ncbi:MAG: type IV pili twitching motility protein PilT [Verrucomicrobia bacterium]|nr:MAG: type IV pili twitching motility protein PilT [Verrucomicrobiota bacterium]
MQVNLESLIAEANQQGASDLHLEAGLPAALRVRGSLRTLGETIPPKTLSEWAREILGEARWQDFLDRRSADLSRTIQGVRCRINILQTSRGAGFAIRLLSTFQATLEKLNLHPDLKKLVAPHNGLVLVSGPTGCGKSSTLAALIQEINLTEARHIVTIESPIEYLFRPRRAYIRQREVGRDTPSFEQALLDALREDPDVLMVGEMRDPQTMRLTLNASETGHLVMATVHSSTCAEALQRVVAAFPSEIQNSVSSQLADCLVAVVAQRLRFRPELNIRVPECEILMPTNPVKAHVRNRDFFKIISALETGAEQGMWTFQRYGNWLERRTNWYVPGQNPETPDSEADDAATISSPVPPATTSRPVVPERKTKPTAPGAGSRGRIEIEPVEGDFGKILR